MVMIRNPNKGKAPKPDVKKAIELLKNSDRYRYSLYISRRMMCKYLNLCKERGVKPNNEMARFIGRELKRYDVIVGADNDATQE